MAGIKDIFFGKKSDKAEVRSSLENPQIPISSQAIVEFFGIDSLSSAGINVSVDSALGVPAVWAAVNFLSGTLASLPLSVYRKTEAGREKGDEKLQRILHDCPSDGQTSFDWRKYSFERTFTGGRQISYIERLSTGEILNIFPVDPANVTVKRTGFKKVYRIKSGQTSKDYPEKDIIDIPFMLKSDGITAISPILQNKDAIGLAIAATAYGSKFFQNGGIPPFVMTGNFVSGKALERAASDVESTIKKQSRENGRQVLTLPAGHDIKQIGVDPEKSQLVELKRFQIEEVARIYSLPPVFLQDLTHGTIGNTEQQDLHLVKHTIRRWVVQAEQELNLKLFGRENQDQYVEFNLDGLLRGDFATRMAGYATAVQNAIMQPAEIRDKENLPFVEKSDSLLIQGATVPLGTQTTFTQPAPASV